MSLNIAKELSKELMTRMRFLKIYEKDLDERFIRSSGRGGQNVNKVSSCVFLCHRPTRISVKCQEERSQAMNRYRARHILADKIEKLYLREERKKQYFLEKEKRKEQQQLKKDKEHILAEKHHHSQIKAERVRIHEHQIEKYLE